MTLSAALQPIKVVDARAAVTGIKGNADLAGLSPGGTLSVALLAMLADSSSMDTPVTIPIAPEERDALVAREIEAQLGPETSATYLRTRNFALGGLMPAELLTTEEGTRQVLAEISAHAEGGPL